jgi:hypothetical protein
MEPLTFHGDAFSQYFLTRLMWDESRLRGRLGEATVEKAWQAATRAIRDGRRALRDRQQPRSTRTLLLNPLAGILGWRLGTEERLETGEGEEDAGAPLLVDSGEVLARIRALAPDVAFDLPPAGRHRRFAPSLSLVRVLEREALAWGVLINAYEVRLIRRSEGFVSSWMAFDLGAIAEAGEAGRAAWRILWAILRDEALQAVPTVLDEVVALGREHAAMVGAGLGRQVQEAVVAFIQGVLDHPANRGRLDPPVPAPADLQVLYAEALRVLYRILFILYGESRGLLPTDMATYREGYSLARLVRLATDAATDPPRAGTAGTFLEDGLRALFELLRAGADLGPEGHIPAYGGGLFDPEATSRLNGVRWGEETVAAVLDRLTFVETARGKLRLSYRELDVEQLGAIYEGLLERTCEVTSEALWPIRLNDRELYVTAVQRAELARRRGETGGQDAAAPAEDEGERGDQEEPAEAERGGDVEEDEGKEEAAGEESGAAHHRKPIRILGPPVPPGRAFPLSGMGRKQTGSYYTSRAFVEFLVRRAVDPLAEGKTPEESLR